MTKVFCDFLASLMFGMLFVAAQTSCLHGTVYGLSDSIDDGGNQGVLAGPVVREVETQTSINRISRKNLAT